MSRLPGILGEIEDVAGTAAALKLARERGGTEMKFSARPGSALALIVGVEAAAKIAELMGSQKYTIPMATERGRAARQVALAHDLSNPTTTPRDAALRHDVHERTAWRVKEKLKSGEIDLGPGPLFADKS